MPQHFFPLVWVMNVLFVAMADDPAAESIGIARQAMAQGKYDEALAAADRAVKAAPNDWQVYDLRGRIHDARREFSMAVTDLDRAIKLNPTLATSIDLRGSVYFKQGNIQKSLADFDRFIKLRPAAEAGHWRRGIACYYAGRFDDGAKQFGGYQSVSTNDVENSVWHFICTAKSRNVEIARREMLPIGFDRRVPLMTVYELFLGQAKPEDVLAAAHSGRPTPQALKTRLFYAHLYLGLYFDAIGDDRRARQHVFKAADDYNVGGYMWEVARVHAERLRRADPPRR